MELPAILEAAPSYLILYKPPRMHTIPLRTGEGGTLLEWCADRFPEVAGLQGRSPQDGGILHRLDYETQGLIVAARTQPFLNALRIQQEEGRFLKEYGARAAPAPGLPGFPPAPPVSAGVITSAFRPYGPGRREVRPVLPGGKAAGSENAVYKTEILSWEDRGNHRTFLLRLVRGFRHQIRCHLAWIGYPLINDPLYGGRRDETAPCLALWAQGLSFIDPDSGAEKRYTL